MLMRAVHPGEVLGEELTELGVGPTEFSRQIAVPPNRVGQIIAGKRSVTGDTALRFAHWFGTDPRLWLNLQSQYDLVRADEAARAPRSGTCLPGPPLQAEATLLRAISTERVRWLKCSEPMARVQLRPPRLP